MAASTDTQMPLSAVYLAIFIWLVNQDSQLIFSVFSWARLYLPTAAVQKAKKSAVNMLDKHEKGWPEGAEKEMSWADRMITL